MLCFRPETRRRWNFCCNAAPIRTWQPRAAKLSCKSVATKRSRRSSPTPSATLPPHWTAALQCDLRLRHLREDRCALLTSPANQPRSDRPVRRVRLVRHRTIALRKSWVNALRLRVLPRRSCPAVSPKVQQNSSAVAFPPAFREFRFRCARNRVRPDPVARCFLPKCLRRPMGFNLRSNAVRWAVPKSLSSFTVVHNSTLNPELCAVKPFSTRDC